MNRSLCLAALAALLCLHACQFQELLPEPEAPENRPLIEEISIREIPPQYLTDLNLSIADPSAREEFDALTFDSAFVKHLINDDVESFTLRTTTSTPEEFVNLMIRVDGAQKYIYLIRYEVDNQWRQENQKPGFIDFTGMITVYNFQNETYSVTRYENGEAIEIEASGNLRGRACIEIIVISDVYCSGPGHEDHGEWHADGTCDHPASSETTVTLICEDGVGPRGGAGGGTSPAPGDGYQDGGGAEGGVINPPDDEDSCPFGYEIYNNLCVKVCPGERARDEYGNCKTDCPPSISGLTKTFTSASTSTLEQLVSIMFNYGKDFGIDTKVELQHFLAQAGHETKGFLRLGAIEDLNYSSEQLVKIWPSRFSQTDTTKLDPDDYEDDPQKLAINVYGNRMGNGDEDSGEGYKYRGRGLFQLTGKNNYQSFNDFYRQNYDSSKDLISNPALIASDNKIAVISALWYYKENVLDNKDINENTDVDAVSEKINPWEEDEGLLKRRQVFKIVKANIKCN